MACCGVVRTVCFSSPLLDYLRFMQFVKWKSDHVRGKFPPSDLVSCQHFCESRNVEGNRKGITNIMRFWLCAIFVVVYMWVQRQSRPKNCVQTKSALPAIALFTSLEHLLGEVFASWLTNCRCLQIGWQFKRRVQIPSQLNPVLADINSI